MDACMRRDASEQGRRKLVISPSSLLLGLLVLASTAMQWRIEHHVIELYKVTWKWKTTCLGFLTWFFVRQMHSIVGRRRHQAAVESIREFQRINGKRATFAREQRRFFIITTLTVQFWNRLANGVNELGLYNISTGSIFWEMFQNFHRKHISDIRNPARYLINVEPNISFEPPVIFANDYLWQISIEQY